MGVTSLPRITAQLLAATGTVGAEPFRFLIVGQTGTDGSATDGLRYTGIESLTNTEVKALFGTKSELTGRILKARNICLSQYALDVIAKDAAGGGTAATRALVYAGDATEDKVMTVNPISQKQYSFNVSIESGDTAVEVATKVKAGFDALDSTFPATNALLSATLTLTANDVGTTPNKYTVEHTNIPAGITVNTNTTSDRAQFASGATDPTLTGIFDDVATTRFHVISWPWESDFSEVQDFLEARNVISNAFLHGVAYIGYSDTEANIASKVNGVTPLNSPNLFFMGNRKVDGANAIIEPGDWITAEFAAIEGLRLTDGAAISNYVATNSLLDNTGGSGTASLGYYATPLAQTSPVDPDILFDEQEQQNLAADGYTIIGVNEASSSTIMGEVVSTYKINGLGNEDTSFKYLNYIRTSFLALEIFFRTLKSDYKQSRLTEGDVVPGRAIANKEAIEAEYTRIYKLLSGPDYVLTQSGSTAEAYFYSNLALTIDVATGEVTSTGQLPIVTQIREFNVTFQVAFSVGG